MKSGFDKRNLEALLISEIEIIEKEFLETTSIENIKYHSSKISFMKKLVSDFNLDPDIMVKLNVLGKG